ncbi:MAG: type II toxin-antitoxin system VapC family toxin [Deltaproteobacteria bacterium]|nr:type II toxin-antitoxin system VapC family toxin [Deltaproteobacteria bacterium]
MTIFINTGAFIARFIAADQHHLDSLEKWELLKAQKLNCITSNHVIDETLTLLARRTSYAFSAEKAHLIYQSNIIQIARPELAEEQSALKLFEKFADQRVSFTDCLSFALMKKLKIQTVFSFDRHFKQAGFEIFG